MRLSNELVPGRQTAAYDGDLVVFLIGMRVNKLRALRQWLPVARSMGPMLTELMKNPEAGLLGFRTFPTWRGVTMVQYWESAEKLQAFAGDPGRTHRPAWLRFFKLAYAGESAGVWHETFVVPAGSHETIYVNMPPLGLGRIKGLERVGSTKDSAAQRLSQA